VERAVLLNWRIDNLLARWNRQAFDFFVSVALVEVRDFFTCLDDEIASRLLLDF